MLMEDLKRMIVYGGLVLYIVLTELIMLTEDLKRMIVYGGLVLYIGWKIWCCCCGGSVSEKANRGVIDNVPRLLIKILRGE